MPVVENTWVPAPHQPVLPPGEIHLWRGMLRLDPVELEARERTLDQAETLRAARFRFPQDRCRFVAAHGLVRLILARYLWVDPATLQFRCGAAGKPALAEPRDWLRFNLSHSHLMALVAVSRHREVGVDVERIRMNSGGAEIAASYFSPGELRMLGAVPPDQRHLAFYALWTRKEAYLKARGEGLGLGLASFDASRIPLKLNTSVALDDPPPSSRRWHLYDLDPPPGGYVAALVAQGCPGILRCYSLQDSGLARAGELSPGTGV